MYKVTLSAFAIFLVGYVLLSRAIASSEKR